MFNRCSINNKTFKPVSYKKTVPKLSRFEKQLDDSQQFIQQIANWTTTYILAATLSNFVSTFCRFWVDCK